jgi:plastocyanin
MPAEQLRQVLGITDVNLPGQRSQSRSSRFAARYFKFLGLKDRVRMVDLTLGLTAKTLGPRKKLKQERQAQKGSRTMLAKNVWVAGFIWAVIIAVVPLLGGSPSATAADPPSTTNAEVKIDNFSFGPQTITVPVGATVTWTNRDDIPHTSVSTDGVFKSKVMDTDEKFSYTFAKVGTYGYYCTIHPKMTGQVVVK